MSYELIETVELTSSAASIEFTSIPQDGTDLVVKASLRNARTQFGATGFVRLNGDSATNYSFVFLRGDGSSVISSSGATESSIHFYINGNTSTSNTFANVGLYVSNYTSADDKSVSIDAVGENNATDSYQTITAGKYTTTSSISSLLVSAFSGDLLEGSSASLYKITAA